MGSAKCEAPFPERRSFGVTLLSDGPDYTIFRVTVVGANSPCEARRVAGG
ncbi:MAG: hypothetical protein QOH51_940 [Acidobacteriota bacterium]|jgi:hypothetical protein|nr:hypothetical protein [Acidobacteriota bacterium]